MAITQAKENLLAHIKEGQIHPNALQQFCNSFSVGPVTIHYCVDLTVPQVTFEVYVAGVRVGSGTINAQHPTVTIGGSVDGIKVEATLTVDFEKRQVTYKVTVCVPIVGCTTYSGILFSW